MNSRARQSPNRGELSPAPGDGQAWLTTPLDSPDEASRDRTPRRVVLPGRVRASRLRARFNFERR